MTDLKDNRWMADEHEFATRVEISDVTGFFYKSLTIEPGTRAMILEQGRSLGEVPPGQYTLQGLTDRLKFWTRKSITAILTREGELPLELDCAGLATSEFLEVDVKVRLLIQIADVALFQKNLLASKSRMTLADLKEIVLPLVQQSLWETIGRLSIKDLTGPQSRTDIELCVGQALGTALIRNGLKFTQVQTLAVSHPEYDETRRRIGTLFLQREGFEHDQAAAELAADQLLVQIQRQEKTDDLEILAQQVAADRMEGDLAVRLRRIGIRKQMREAARAGHFDRILSEEEVNKFLQQRDKERLLRDDEFATLQATLKDQTADRAAVRAQLLRKLELEQQADLQGIRVDLDFAQRIRTRNHEIALAELNDSEDSRAWKRQLERESADAAHRRQEQLKAVEHDRLQAKTFATEGRAEEWEEQQHDLRMDRVQGEIEITRAERGQRVALVALETHKAQSLADIEITRAKASLEQEINNNASLNQFERLKQVTELNLMAKKAHDELTLANRRTEAEIEDLKEDRASQRMVSRLRELKGGDKYFLIAAADEKQAALLADVVKTESTQAAVAETAKAQSAAAQSSDARLAELRAQMSDAQRQQYDQMIATMQQAMQNQTAGFGQFGTILENVTRNLAPQSPPSPTVVVAGGGAVSTSGPQGSHEAAPRTIVCAGCRAENREADRFCRQCGKQL